MSGANRTLSDNKPSRHSAAYLGCCTRSNAEWLKLLYQRLTERDQRHHALARLELLGQPWTKRFLVEASLGSLNRPGAIHDGDMGPLGGHSTLAHVALMKKHFTLSECQMLERSAIANGVHGIGWQR
ncbi:hypothetical protein [Acidovorax sp. CF316]|uniref:hypothetical protein n=1 Tax=Acidovorax sp. CF316 TaxID=1144317 RepID=UPI0011B28AD4|nr:hypothetical protein [Acidovorax sp. CF316]